MKIYIGWSFTLNLFLYEGGGADKEGKKIKYYRLNGQCGVDSMSLLFFE